jgi:hypothetical protein
MRPLFDPIVRALPPVLGGGGLPWDDAGGIAAQLPAQILGLLGSGAGGGVQGLYLARASDVSLVSGNVERWRDSSGLARDATQSTGALRPAWSTSAVNSRPALSYDGTKLLTTAAIDLSSFERITLSMLFLDTNTTQYVAGDFTDIANGMCRLLISEVDGRLAASGRAATGVSETRSAASHTMATAGMVRGAVDYTLTTQATRIWLNTTDVSSSFAGDPNLSAQAVGNGPLFIGNRSAGDLGLNGALAAVMLCAWPTATAFPASALATAERSLMSAWGVA